MSLCREINIDNIMKHIVALGSGGPRYVSFPGETMAKDYLMYQLKQLPVEVWTEPFMMKAYIPDEAWVYGEGIPNGRAGAQPLAYSPIAFGGVCKGELVDIGTALPLEYAAKTKVSLKDKIIISSNIRTFLIYPQAVELGAMGAIFISGFSGAVRAGATNFDRIMGTIPAVSVTLETGNLLSKVNSQVELVSLAHIKEHEAFNIWARINPGNVKQKNTAKYLSVAHYDSFWLGPHAADNASGCATILELIRVLSQKTWECQLDFGLFSGEELGMWGSKYHVDNDPGDAASINAVLSLDGMAERGSSPEIGVTDELKPFIESLVKTCSFPVEIWSSPPRPVSDHKYYTAAGVPTLWIGGLGPMYHTALDVPAAIDTDLLNKCAQLSCMYLEELAVNNIK